jgi:hypothetical protein
MVETVKMKCRNRIYGTEWEDDISNNSINDIESWPEWNSVENIGISIEAL